MGNKMPGTGKLRMSWANLGLAILMRNLTYVFFLAVLGVIYIGNAHYAEKNLRYTNVLEEKIREAKWEYMTLKSEVMQKSTRSELGRELNGYERLDDQKMPKKIEVSKS